MYRFISGDHVRSNDVITTERTPPNGVSHPFIAAGQSVAGTACDSTQGSVYKLRRYIEHVACDRTNATADAFPAYLIFRWLRIYPASFLEPYSELLRNLIGCRFGSPLKCISAARLPVHFRSAD